MGEIIKPVPAPGTTISPLGTSASITQLSGSYTLATAYGPTCNFWSAGGLTQYLLGISFNLSGSGPDIGSFIIEFVYILYRNTSIVSCTSDLPYSNGHYITGNIVTFGPDTGKLKIAYETNTPAFIQVFIFGQQF